jgi:chromosomal replication initiation ATPase DnaA
MNTMQHCSRPVAVRRRIEPRPVSVKAILSLAEHQVALADILRAVAYTYHVPVRVLVSNRRDLQAVRARRAYYVLATCLTMRSSSEIGRECGDRDHSTVLHGVNRWRADPGWLEPEFTLLLARAKTGRISG